MLRVDRPVWLSAKKHQRAHMFACLTPIIQCPTGSENQDGTSARTRPDQQCQQERPFSKRPIGQIETALFGEGGQRNCRPWQVRIFTGMKKPHTV